MVATNDVKFAFPLKFTRPLCRLQLTTFNPALYPLPLTIWPFTLSAGQPLLVTRAALLKPTHQSLYQRVSIASYASAGIARGGMSVCLSVRPSVRPSVRHTPVLYQNEQS